VIPLLTENSAVAQFAAVLAEESIIAVDLEADSLHSYNEKVCLLQVTIPGKTVLIDPLAADDLTPFGAVLADPAIVKIFHAADYDIRCLYRDFGFTVRGLFDTMISSQFLGEEKVGLADMLNKYFGVELNKQYQRADWSMRPLSAPMLDYAAEDTNHLHKLHALLEKRLIGCGRRDWVTEEFLRLEEGRFLQHDGPLCLRVKGAGRLDRRQLAILEGLLQWRDGEARKRDCPSFKVIGPQALLAIATKAPETLDEMAGLEGLFPRLVERYGKHFLTIVATARALPTEALPIFPRSERREKDPLAEKRFMALREWRKNKAIALELDAGILINNALLEEISRQIPKTLDDFDSMPLMRQWQKRELGTDILNVINGKRG